MILWTMWSFPGPEDEKQAQILTFSPPCFTAGRRFFWWYVSKQFNFGLICPQNGLPESFRFLQVLSGSLHFQCSPFVDDLPHGGPMELKSFWDEIIITFPRPMFYHYPLSDALWDFFSSRHDWPVWIHFGKTKLTWFDLCFKPVLPNFFPKDLSFHWSISLVNLATSFVYLIVFTCSF